MSASAPPGSRHTVVHLDGFSSSSSPSNSAAPKYRASDSFWIPDPLLLNPDDKDRFGNPDSPGCVRAARYVMSTIQPWKPLLCVTLWAPLVVQMATVASKMLPSEKRSQCQYMCTPLGVDHTVPAYHGVALFMLLGFRVNEAYGRYQRGLEIWNEMIAKSVYSFALNAGRTFPEGMFHKGDTRRIFSWLAAFPVCLKRRLRGERDVPELALVMSPEDLELLHASPNMPICCLETLNSYVLLSMREQRSFPQNFIIRMVDYTSNMALSMLRAESIANFPVSYGYIAHLRIFMGIWLVVLPFALVQDCGWYTAFLVPIISFGLLAMEKIASELTQPFGYDYNDIPIGKISNEIVEKTRRIYIDLKKPIRELLHECDVPELD